MLSPATAHMPPFTSVTASGLVMYSGGDPPAIAGRILTLTTVTPGFSFFFNARALCPRVFLHKKEHLVIEMLNVYFFDYSSSLTRYPFLSKASAIRSRVSSLSAVIS